MKLPNMGELQGLIEGILNKNKYKGKMKKKGNLKKMKLIQIY